MSATFPLTMAYQVLCANHKEPFGLEILEMNYPTPPIVLSKARAAISAKPIMARPLKEPSGCEPGICACHMLDNPRPGTSKGNPEPGPSKGNWRLANPRSCVKKRQPKELTEDDEAEEERMRIALMKMDEKTMLNHFKRLSDAGYMTGTKRGRFSQVLKRIQERDADMGDDPTLEKRAIVLKSAGKSCFAYYL